MIVYIDLEHERLRSADPAEWERSAARRLKHKYRFEDITGDQCLIVRYQHATPELLQRLQARAVLMSGCFTDFEHYREEDLQGLRQIYRQAAQPILGFCAGHQLMAQSRGATIGAMGTRSGGDQRKDEFGFMPVRVQQPHPLFDRLPTEIIVFEAHYWEVKQLPQYFRPFAESDLCPVQMMAHDTLPLFGTQFHPEEYDETHPHGRTVLENFFALAGLA